MKVKVMKPFANRFRSFLFLLLMAFRKSRAYRLQTNRPILWLLITSSDFSYMMDGRCSYHKIEKKRGGAGGRGVLKRGAGTPASVSNCASSSVSEFF